MTDVLHALQALEKIGAPLATTPPSPFLEIPG
jgi:hypothetical protein